MMTGPFSYTPFTAQKLISGTTHRKVSLADLLQELKTPLVQAEQVHADRIAVVGREHTGTIVRNVDALITAEQQIPLVIRTADCAPIFIWDPVRSVIGLVHAGRKGTILGITHKTIEHMGSTFHTRPEDCLAAIGPSIGVCCYEIDPVTHEHFDLITQNTEQLLALGIPSANISATHICTACRTDICFSYRKEGQGTGRLYSALMLK